jgi:hypothetical protein
MFYRFAEFAFVALPLLMTAPNLASAQTAPPAPLPRAGDFVLIYTFSNPQPWAPIPRAVDATGAVTQTLVVNTNTAWLMNAAGSGFGNQMTGRCGQIALAEGAVNVEVHGNCVYTDAQGDMLFEKYDRVPGEATTTGKWTGGTGKYAGVTSTFNIVGFAGFAGRTEGAPVGITPPVGLYQLYSMSAGTKTGSYTLPALLN